MNALSYRDLRERIRRVLRDAHGLLWDDAGLDGVIDEAQREYALSSGTLSREVRVSSAEPPRQVSLRSKVSVRGVSASVALRGSKGASREAAVEWQSGVGEQNAESRLDGTGAPEGGEVFAVDGVFECPEDYIEPVKFVLPSGEEVPFYSWGYVSELYPDFRKVRGDEVRGIIPDFDGYGKLRLFPVISAGEFAGKLIYKCYPRNGEVCTTNFEAVAQHCLYQMFLLTDGEAAVYHYKRFQELVNREQSERRGIAVRKDTRRGRFF